MKKLGCFSSFAVYIPAAILMVCLTKYLIPFLSRATRCETILIWFIVAGLGIFTPLIFIQSYAVQKTKNSWIGVIMHRGLNDPSFIAICFGFI
ncbi:hypothetical protein JW835_03960 [bacterium]|nr:hypothetical protein [bacterium]